MFRKRFIPALVLSLLLGGQAARADMFVSGYSPANARFFDRFLNHDDFIGNPFDWTGVGQSPENPIAGHLERFGTMISPHHFISATHSSPSDTLRFFDDDGNVIESHNVASLTQIAGSDLTLGTLVTPVSSQVAIYPILVLSSTEGYAGLEVYTFGLSTSQEDQRMGTNIIESSNPRSSTTVWIDPAAPDGPIFAYDQDAAFGEARVSSGDSGGPTFVNYQGQMAIVGLHWLTGGNYTFDNFVPAWVDELNAAMALAPYGESVTVVPEPGATALLLLVGGVAAWRYRRRAVRA